MTAEITPAESVSDRMDINMYMEKDNFRVAGQNYGIISIVSPTSNQKYDKLAIKFKGCFNTYEEAKAHAQKLHKIDSTFDIHVIELYSWIVVPPAREAIGEVHYENGVLDNLVNEHLKQQDLARVEFEKYKREMLEYGRKHAIEAKEKEETKELEDTKADTKDEPSVQSLIESCDELNFSREPLQPVRQNASSE